MHELGKEKAKKNCVWISQWIQLIGLSENRSYIKTSQTCERSHREANNTFEGAPEFRCSEQNKGAADKHVKSSA